MSRVYPLDIENIGEDVYQLMSRGHHDFVEFMRAALSQYPWPMGKPWHTWFRTVPSNDPGTAYLYVEAVPHSRGAFPVTVTIEDYSENRYRLPAEVGERP